MSDTGKTILGWWRAALDREPPRGRALSAKLRRASALEVLCEPEVHDLARALGMRDAPRLVRLVSVLAEVRAHSSVPLARVLGGADPKLSKARFERLLRSTDDALVTDLKRAARMANAPCNVASLGEDLMFWNENTRARWCFNYFGVDAPEPVSEEISE